MSVGLNPSKTDIDLAAGNLARLVQQVFNQVKELDYFLDAASTEQLVAKGYTAGEVALLKSAVSDLDQLRTIYTGDAALANVKDFRTFARQLWGLGAL